MAGPTDAFFRDTLRAVGGKLLESLPELEKRQAAAGALGARVTLAEVAVQQGLIDRAKLEELGALESGSPPSKAAPRPPSTPRVPAAPPSRPAPIVRRRLRDRAKALSSAAVTALRSVTRGRADAARAEQAATRDLERKVALGVGIGLLALLVVVGIAYLVNRPAPEPPPPPSTGDADVTAAAKAASKVPDATPFGGDRDPNWWARRQAAIDTPASELVGDPSKRASGTDTVAAFVKEHRVGSFHFKAHERWREVSSSGTTCIMVDDGSIPSLLAVVVANGTRTANDLIELTKRGVPASAHPTETTPCHEKIGAVSATGAGFDLQEAGQTVQVRAYELTLNGQKLLVIVRSPAGEARLEIGRILATIE